MKNLVFRCRGELFEVNETGEINAYNQQSINAGFSGEWLFKGVSYHHWSNRINFTFKDAWKEPEKLVGGLVWDLDHGTTRRWGGNYLGKLPRITDAWIE